jgi:hypothetical protein
MVTPLNELYVPQAMREGQTIITASVKVLAGQFNSLTLQTFMDEATAKNPASKINRIRLQASLDNGEFLNYGPEMPPWQGDPNFVPRNEGDPWGPNFTVSAPIDGKDRWFRMTLDFPDNLFFGAAVLGNT